MIAAPTIRRPLSGAQAGIWYAQQLDPHNPMYNTGEYVDIQGHIEPATFEAALRQVLMEAESLHARFEEDHEGPWQVLTSGALAGWTMHYMDLSKESEPEQQAETWMTEDLSRSCHLTEGPLFTEALFKIGAERYLWYQRIHHIAIDGYGFSLLTKRTAQVYTAMVQRQAYSNGRFGSWHDVLDEDESYRSSEKAEADRRFWIERLKDAPDVVSLSDRTPRSASSILRQSAELPAAMAAGLHQCAQLHGVTWSEVILAAAASYLHRLTGAEDIILGVPMMNRLGSVSVNTPGMVMNIVPLRLQVRPAMVLSELLRQAARETREARKHQSYRHEELRRDLKRTQDGRRLYGPMVNMMPFDTRLLFGGIPGSTHNLSAGPVDDLAINVYFKADGTGLQIDMDGNPGLYTAEELRAHHRRFIYFLQNAAYAQPDEPIGCLALLNEEERVDGLLRWNQTDRPVPRVRTSDLFERQALLCPNRIALVHEAGMFSFAELNARANQLARFLIARGVGPQRFVAIAVPRSAEMIVSMLAVHKTGAAYLPLDLDFPEERIAYMVEDAAALVMLTTAEAAAKLPHLTQVPASGLTMHDGGSQSLTTAAGQAVIQLDDPAVQAELTAFDEGNVAEQERLGTAQQADPAYILYTSGSTGKPKGVVIPYTALTNFLLAMGEQLQLTAEDRLLAVTTISFDISILEIFMPLISGARLIITDKRTIQDPAVLSQLIRSSGATLMQATPSLWHNLVEQAPEGLRGLRALVGGEALSSSLLHDLQTLGCEVTNLYGPTETTIWSTSVKYAPDSRVPKPSIGRPIWNTQLYILDSGLEPVPPGVTGDLYIAGEGLALGYWKRPGLTAERFVANPYGPPGSRMYRTGDMARWLPDGSVDYCGRADHQIKIRGYRVETSEIEAVMSSYPGLLQVAVAAREDRPGDIRLAAYFVANEAVDPAMLRVHMAAALPDYMVPSAFVAMEQFPQTPNGKLDRKALPAPHYLTGPAGRAARTPQEEMLCELFAEVLGVPQVGTHDDFFDLGGHSLLASRLVSRIREGLQVELSLASLFEAPTAAGIAKQIDRAAAARPPICPVARPADIPLSFAQRRLWFMNCLEGPSPTYNIPLVVRLTGPLNQRQLEAALQDVVRRHETLRTVFPEQNGAAKQQVLDADACTVELLVSKVTEEGLAEELNAAVRYGFDLAKELSFRAQLYVLGPEEHVLLLLLHHIVGDGWSLDPLTRDLSAAYEARAKGEAPVWPPLPVQYADYALWQERLLGDESDPGSLIARQIAFWQETLRGLPDQLELPADYPRPVESSHTGDTVAVRLPAKLHTCLLALARETRTSLFMVVQSGLAALFTRLGAGTDIPLGSPVAGRSDDALSELVGLFINTIILRTDTSGDPSFRELLGRVRGSNLAAYEHGDVPFERLVEILNPPRSRARHPLFQVMLAFQNTPEPRLLLDGVSTELRLATVGRAKFDLTIEFRERRLSDGTPDGIDGWFEFSSDLYERVTIEKLAARLQLLLEEASAEPDKPIGLLPILMPEEQAARALLSVVPTADPREDTWAGRNLVELFQEQVAKSPDAVAVTYEGESLTYDELNVKANQLAHYLISRGIGPDQLVGLLLPRSLTMMVGVLAVLKAGAGYLPLDPDYPLDRLTYMLEDTNPACVISCLETASVLDGEEVLLVDELHTAELLSRYPANDPADSDRVAPLTPDAAAYIIFTSGSTGKPKGVVIPHSNVVRLFSSTDQWYDFGPQDVWTLFHSYAFDFSVWEMWGALLYGGRLVIVPHQTTRSPDAFLELVCKERVTVLNQTPSAFYPFMQADKEHTALSQTLSLRYVIFGGEALDLGQLRDWYERHDDKFPLLVNMYGITETTVHVSYCPLSSAMTESSAGSLIGGAIPDLQVYVLDHYMQHVPTGVTGEMYVAGAGLARGYWKRPGLTAERFLADPYGPEGARMYRTGDLARWLEDGTLDYLGRIDHQVKIRGFRIELGEIEAVVAQVTGVTQAIVMAREDVPGDKRLVAYVVPAAGNELDTGELRQHVTAALPNYMVPSAFVVMAELPLTVNGKLDRKSLPAPDYSLAAGGRGPRTPQEEILCDLYAETLGLTKVGIDDGFFDLGGHSLLAVKLMSGIREALGVSLGIGILFEAPTVAGLAARLEGGGSEGALEVLLPLRTSGSRPPFFCVHPAGGLSWCYAGLMKSLGPDYPIYGLQARGISRKEPLPADLMEMAADYISHIRSVQPKGPYYLLGWSLGGNVAHAMASLLQADGEEIALLVMLDAFPSHFLPISEGPNEEEALIALLALGGYDPDSLGGKALDMEAAVNILRSDGSALASLEPSVIISLKDTYVNSVRILGAYRPGPYKGDLLFVHSTVIPDWFTPISPDTWQPYITGTIEQHDLACRHKDLCQPGPLSDIGRIISRKLEDMHRGEK